MPNILVVDDEMSIREAIKILLLNEGFKVETAKDAEEALRLLARKPFDLVLTDLLMPKIDGFEFIKHVRRTLGMVLPVIVLTAHGTTDIASLAVQEGVSDFILKPFESKALSDAVKYALTKPSLIERASKAKEDSDFEKRFFGLSMLDDLRKTVSQATELQPIAASLLEWITPMLVPSRALAVIYDRNGADVKASSLWEAHPGLASLANVDRIVMEWISKSGQPMLVEDLARETRIRSIVAGIHVDGSMLAVPLMHKQVFRGGLLLYRDTKQAPYTEETMKLLSTVAGLASAALEIADLYDELKMYFTSTVRALISTVEIKDPAVYGHSTRVARYALGIAKRLHFEDLELRRLEYLALLHDIGKIGIPESILRKHPDVSREEDEIFKTHVVLGENIVRAIHFLPDGGRIVRLHHEWFNGQGYPDGLKGEAIPLYSRIIAVADAFDLFMMKSPHREILQPHQIAEAMREMQGGRLDPALVPVFLEAYQAGSGA